MDQQQVAESRLALHIGPLSFVMLLMDIAAVGFRPVGVMISAAMLLLITMIALATHPRLARRREFTPEV